MVRLVANSTGLTSPFRKNRLIVTIVILLGVLPTPSVTWPFKTRSTASAPQGPSSGENVIRRAGATKIVPCVFRVGRVPGAR